MSKYMKHCPICPARFNSIYALHQHCVKEHPWEFICCPICYEPLKYCVTSGRESVDDLVMHSNLVHDRQTKKLSGIRTEDFEAFKKYRFDERMIDGNQCVACSTSFNSRETASRHYKGVHLSMKYLCHRCPRVFGTVRTLKVHHSNEHDGSRIHSSTISVSPDFAGFKVIETEEAHAAYDASCAVAPKRFKPQETVAFAESRETRLEPTVKSPTGIGISGPNNHCHSSPMIFSSNEDLTGFKTMEIQEAQSAYDAVKQIEIPKMTVPSGSRESKFRGKRAASSIRAGIKIWDDPFEFSPLIPEPLLKLTRIEKKVVKLRPTVMNDLEFVEIDDE